MAEIHIIAGDAKIVGVLNESTTAKLIWDGLPMEGRVNTWGDEIYFEIPIDAEQDVDARQDVEVGDLGYWPTGRAFCIFFGPTPVSVDERPRAASPVNIIGSVSGDISPLHQIPDGAKIQIKKAGD
jgi:hypothetical protein